ncbi:RING-H2 finger protein ATL52-like [Bradysia coprophila]|uniref:RING-H2 finger protein ATL52-like n=1 Tax=Bradysia coprophila TaxID=38358 RepID=UPI00187DCB28|nr:RING-H2 finger protein ATL52-like [Bradysia coprophila]
MDVIAAARISQIEQITKAKVSDNDTHSSCSICISDFMKNEIILILPCVHKFHRTCIQTWLSKNNTCPSCRERVFEDTDPFGNADDSSSDESVNVDIADFSFDLQSSINSLLHSADMSDVSDVSVASDSIASDMSDDESDMSGIPDLSGTVWGYSPSPSDTLEMVAGSDDSSSNAASDDSSDETDVMNESHITVTSESEDSEHSDASAMVFPISSDESSDSDLMLYDSDNDSSD